MELYHVIITTRKIVFGDIYIYNLSSVNYLSIGTTGNMANVRSSECHFKNVYIWELFKITSSATGPIAGQSRPNRRPSNPNHGTILIDVALYASFT